MTDLPILPANLKEAAFLRRVAKALGMQASSSAAHVMRRLEELRAKQPARSLAASPVDVILRALHAGGVSQDELRQAVRMLDVPAALAPAAPPQSGLPDPLQAVLREQRK